MHRLLPRHADTPVRPHAETQQPPAGLQPNGRHSYHPSLLRLTVTFLNGNIVTAGLTIPELD